MFARPVFELPIANFRQSDAVVVEAGIAIPIVDCKEVGVDRDVDLAGLEFEIGRIGRIGKLFVAAAGDDHLGAPDLSSTAIIG